jgi:hypothetical protein
MSNHESARRAYIRLLSEYSVSTAGASREQRDLDLSAELIDGGFLSGSPGREDGTVAAVEVTGLTVQGRLFLQRLLAEEVESSFRGRTLKYLPIIIGYVAGLLSPVITDWLRSLIVP